MRRIDYSPAVRGALDVFGKLDDREVTEAMLPRGFYASAEFFEFERDAVFGRSWVCVGRADQIPNPGDYLTPQVAGEPLLVARTDAGALHAMSALCQHRGQVLTCEAGSRKSFKCPLHFWTWDLEGRLINAPRMGGAEAVAALRASLRLTPVKLELWHGFVFVNLDPDAKPLAPSLQKLEATWAGYEDADLVSVPPVPADKPLPWNWKVQLENFTDAYHPEYVHIGTHDFAPSTMRGGDGVAFTEMREGDNAIVRTVPMVKPDGGMMKDGWGETAMFPAIESLSLAQRSRLTFAMVPPNMQLMFAPGVVAYTLINPVGAEATFASSDRVTGGGWILPRKTRELPDFAERAAAVREGASKIWAQDVPVNLAMQAGKRSRLAPKGCYGPLETTLQQFNQWLVWTYKSAWQAAE